MVLEVGADTRQVAPAFDSVVREVWAGATPDNSNKCGVLMLPAASTTSSRTLR